MTFLHAEIDLAPKHLEVVNRRHHRAHTTSHSSVVPSDFKAG